MTQLDLVAIRTADWAPTILLYYRGALLAGVGATISMQVRAGPSATAGLILDVPSIPYQDAGGTLILTPHLTPAQLAAAPDMPVINGVPVGFHEIKATLANGFIARVAIGHFTLISGINTR